MVPVEIAQRLTSVKQRHLCRLLSIGPWRASGNSISRFQCGHNDLVQALIASTQVASISNTQLGSNLLALLNTALQAFQQGQADAGNTALSAYPSTPVHTFRLSVISRNERRSLESHIQSAGWHYSRRRNLPSPDSAERGKGHRLGSLTNSI
jgi:hypothetical protein